MEKVRNKFSSWNFRQCTSRHLLTRTTEGLRGERGKENSVAKGCRMNHGDRKPKERQRERKGEISGAQ